MRVFKRRFKKPTVERIEAVIAIRCPLENFNLKAVIDVVSQLGEYEVLSVAKITMPKVDGDR